MVRAQRLATSGDVLLDPDSSEWGSVAASELPLQPTPLIAQPSVYVQEKWKEQPYGLSPRLEVRAAHDGEVLYFRLSWADETSNDGIRDTDQFADAGAVLFPVGEDAPLQGMGSPQEPVNAWYWRPDLEQPYSVTAQGTGTTRRTNDPELQAQGWYADGAWALVIRRRLAADAAAGYVNLAPGATKKVAFAVWQGANQERGGLKAVSADWEPLEIED